MDIFRTIEQRAAYEHWRADMEKGLGPDDTAPDTSEDAYIDWLLNNEN